MSELAVGSLKGLAANDFVIDVAAGSTLNVPPPAILQVKSTTLATRFTTGSTSFTPLTGLSVDITPTSVSSQIFIVCDINYGGSERRVGPTFRFMRNTTPVGIGDADGSRARATGGGWVGDGANVDVNSTRQSGTMNMSFLDTPASTSLLTYSVDVGVSSNAMSVNGSFDNPDSGTLRASRKISTITVMEVAG